MWVSSTVYPQFISLSDTNELEKKMEQWIIDWIVQLKGSEPKVVIVAFNREWTWCQSPTESQACHSLLNIEFSGSRHLTGWLDLPDHAFIHSAWLSSVTKVLSTNICIWIFALYLRKKICPHNHSHHKQTGSPPLFLLFQVHVHYTKQQWGCTNSQSGPQESNKPESHLQ